MFDKAFEIKIDASKCISLVEGGAFLDGKKEYDSWRFKDIKLESGKIYGLIGEYGQGAMYLSYLIGGKVDFGDLRLFCNGQELSRNMLEQISWNKSNVGLNSYKFSVKELKFCRKTMNKILKKCTFYNIIILKKCIVDGKLEVKYVF